MDNRYSESESESPKKLDKRQETVLKDLKSYLLTEYATEQEQREKLRQLGVSFVALKLLPFFLIIIDPNRGRCNLIFNLRVSLFTKKKKN